MNRFYGVTVALVKSLDDPEEQGRVKLAYPWLPDEGAGADSGWAPILRPLAGKDRGFYYMPEVDDEALVAFQFGDWNHPVVLGFLHNGVDLPPFDGIDRNVRRLKSVAGHVLELDDRAGQESIRLHTENGHQLELHDPTGYVELVTNGGQKIRMQDHPAQIELTTASGVSVTISDIGGVSVSAPTGSVTVDSLSAQVTSTGSASLQAPSVKIDTATLNVNTAMATFAGVVQCQTLMTQSVISPAYTPGVGNIW